LVERPQSIGDYFCCAYLSLSLSYKNAVEELEKNTGMFFDKIYIVGGGAKNAFLNRMTAYMTKKRVVALPIEATAIGNLKIQMEAAKC
jgi:rhamnulokinase